MMFTEKLARVKSTIQSHYRGSVTSLLLAGSPGGFQKGNVRDLGNLLTCGSLIPKSACSHHMIAPVLQANGLCVSVDQKMYVPYAVI